MGGDPGFWNVAFSGSASRVTGCGKGKEGTAPESTPAPGLIDRALENPAAACDALLLEEKNDPRQYHLCLLEEHLKIHEKFKKASLMRDIQSADNALEAMAEETSFWDDPFGALNEYVFSVARDVNFQASNWLMVDAAQKSLQFYSLTREAAYLAKAFIYLSTALQNEDHNTCFDLYRSPLELTIWPVEAYFEIKLSEIGLYRMTDPVKSIELGNALENDLANPRFLQAQRSNPRAAEGYLNRLKMMGIETQLGMETTDWDNDLKVIRDIHQWYVEQQERNLAVLTLDGIKLIDLQYDELKSTLLAGKIYLKKGDFAAAAETFQQVLSTATATRKYGGFLDLGIEAFFSLLFIALKTSDTLDAAAYNFARLVNPDGSWGEKWEKMPADLKEGIGLMVREVGWCYRFSHSTYLPCTDLNDVLGEVFMSVGINSWSPEDHSSVLSDIPLLDNKEKLELVLLILPLISLDPNLKDMIGQRLPELN